MGRAPKTPKKDYFNRSDMCFGPWQQHDGKIEIDPQKKVIAEFGCGKAILSFRIAEKNPSDQLIAIDLKSERMAFAARKAEERGVANISFLQTDSRSIMDYLPEQSIDDLWVTFPDPFPRKRQAKHRQTHKDFLELYVKLLKPTGRLRFKTDDTDLFQYSIEQLAQYGWRITSCTFDVYDGDVLVDDEVRIKTQYEEIWLEEGRIIKYLEAVPANS